MFGTLKIRIGVQIGQFRRIITVYTKGCPRTTATEEIRMFKLLNPELINAIADITWQAETEYL